MTELRVPLGSGHEGQIAFLSHNRDDKEVAREIALFLATEGVSVWFDEWAVAVGGSIVREVNAALACCAHFILLWSASAARSPWVEQEIEAMVKSGIETKRPVIVPILLDATPLPPLISHLRHIEYHGGTEDDRRTIVRAIVEREPSSSYIRAVVRKYKELVHGTKGFDFLACPECGSERIRVRECADYQSEESRVVVDCEECGWGDLLG